MLTDSTIRTYFVLFDPDLVVVRAADGPVCAAERSFGGTTIRGTRFARGRGAVEKIARAVGAEWSRRRARAGVQRPPASTA